MASVLIKEGKRRPREGRERYWFLQRAIAHAQGCQQPAGARRGAWNSFSPRASEEPTLLMPRSQTLASGADVLSLPAR